MSVYLRKYNVTLDGSTPGSLKIRVAHVKRDETAWLGSGDWTPAAGDVKVSKDGGTEANIGTLPAYANGAWEYVLSGTELTAKNVTVRIDDAAVDLFQFTVETFGHASAMWPLDYVDAVRQGMSALPNAAAEAAGGLYTRGTGAGQINQDGNGRIDVRVYSFLASAITAAAFNANALVAATFATDYFAAIRSALGLATNNLDTQLGDLPTNAELATAFSNVTQAQRVRVSVPQWLERPDASSTAYRVWIYVYDEQHKAEDLDSLPTVTATNAAGTDRSANLGTVTKPGATTGIYYVDYTVADSHALEQISFDVAATEGAVTTHYPAATIVVDYTASAFTPTDRADLLATKASAATAANQSTNAASSAASADGKATAIQAKTDLIPAVPASQGDVTAVETNVLAKVLKWFRLSLRKDSAVANDHATELGEINANTGTGTGAFANTTDAQEALRDRGDAAWSGGGGGSALTGPYVLTVTVTDADTSLAIENALVRVWLNSDTESQYSTDLGKAIYAVGDAAAWNIAIDRYGYESYVGTFEVDGDHVDLPIELEPTTIAVSPAGTLTLYAEVKKVNTAGDGLEASGAGVVLRLQVKNGPDGIAVPGTVLVATTGSNSIAAFTGIPHGANYEVWHGTATTKKRRGIAPSSGTDDTIPFVVGSA